MMDAGSHATRTAPQRLTLRGVGLRRAADGTCGEEHALAHRVQGHFRRWFRQLLPRVGAGGCPPCDSALTRVCARASLVISRAWLTMARRGLYRTLYQDTPQEFKFKGLGVLQVNPSATGARNYSQCDSMLIGDQVGVNASSRAFCFHCEQSQH